MIGEFNDDSKVPLTAGEKTIIDDDGHIVYRSDDTVWILQRFSEVR